MADGLIFDIREFAVHDGPGIRTTVFLKGCPLACQWCHTPEGISPRREIVVITARCTGCGECRAACPADANFPGTGALPPRRDACTLCGACVDACPTGARQMLGREMTVAEVMATALQDRIFYEDSGGGVTISGGEPLAQPRFLLALTEALHTAGIPVARRLTWAVSIAGLVMVLLAAAA